MESVITVSENVRPSSPTPQNLRTYKFSMLDQIAPSMLIRLVLFFPPHNYTNPEPDHFSVTLETLKRSLSLVLTRFYPFAGRINSDGKSIDCHDQGLPFLVSQVKPHKLSDILRNRDENLVGRLLPCEETRHFADRSVAVLQVNCFGCGGIAIGAAFTHKVGDAMTIATFLKSWAAATRGCKEPVCPNYIVHSMFPHKEDLSEFIPPNNILKTGKAVTRRYVFDASAILSLKSEADVERPTRVEVVTALIWKCFMAASPASESLVSHVVDLRRRATPPFPSDCFGNFVGAAVAKSGGGSRIGDLVRKLREAIRQVDDDYVGRMRGDDGHLGLHANIKVGLPHYHEGVDYLGFTSWASIGFYSIDFGWGKPIWVANFDIIGRASSPTFFNEVFMMDTRNGDGIEAWVNLDKQYISVLDNCEELRAFASVDPTPLDIQ